MLMHVAHKPLTTSLCALKIIKLRHDVDSSTTPTQKNYEKNKININATVRIYKADMQNK